MYAPIYIYILATTVQIGLSQFEEASDLSSALSPLNYEVFERIQDWQEEEPKLDVSVADSESISQAVLEEKCRGANGLIYVSEEDITIDCDAFKNSGEPVPEAEARVIKRSANDNDVEGSGDDSVSEPNNQTTAPSVSKQETNVSESSGANSGNQTTVASAKTEPPQMPEKTDPNSSVETTEKGSIAPNYEDDQAKPNENQTSPEHVPEETTEPDTTTHETNENVIKENATATDISDKDKDAEIIHNKPGGKTLLNGPKKEENRESPIGDKAVKADESNEKPKATSSKDTTILIGLFAAVVVVGALAFGYNYVKKRKQQSADIERIERAPVKRSVQNLNNKIDGEAEQKPLIENKKDVEMVNMKKTENTNGVDETTNQNNTAGDSNANAPL